MTEHKDVAIELAMGDTRVIWTANKPWGHFAYIVGGTMYRPARPRETPHLNLTVKDGVLKLRKMSRWERETVLTPVVRPKTKKKKVRRGLASLS